MKMEHEIQVVITLSEDAMTKLGKIEEVLSRAGVRVDRVLDNIGIIRAHVHQSLIPALSKIEGVVDVQPDHEVRLSPPEE